MNARKQNNDLGGLPPLMIKVFQYLLFLFFMTACASRNKEDVFVKIKSSDVMLVELSDAQDLSLSRSKRIRCYSVLDKNIAEDVLRILLLNKEKLQRSLNSSTLPFGFVSVYDVSEKQLLSFKLDQELSDKVKAVLVNKEEVKKESDWFLVNFSSETFFLLPKNNPFVMRYNISQPKFRQALEGYQKK